MKCIPLPEIEGYLSNIWKNFGLGGGEEFTSSPWENYRKQQSTNFYHWLHATYSVSGHKLSSFLSPGPSHSFPSPLFYCSFALEALFQQNVFSEIKYLGHYSPVLKC